MQERAISSTFNNAEAPIPEMIVRVIGKDGTYGLNGAHTNTSDDPIIEFYDPRHRHARLEGGLSGQFIARYRMSTLEGHHGGINLDGGIPDWKVSDYGLQEAMRSARQAALLLSGEDNALTM